VSHEQKENIFLRIEGAIQRNIQNEQKITTHVNEQVIDSKTEFSIESLRP
jgi:hypothetical protein